MENLYGAADRFCVMDRGMVSEKNLALLRQGERRYIIGTASHWARQTEDHYLLRSNITDWEPQRIREAYIHLTDAKEAFHIHKSDLHLRPV